MNTEQINAAIAIAGKLQYFFIATADREGVPHVATAGAIAVKSPDTVEISFWFCPVTIDNLQKNKKVALIIWEAEKNAGYQLLGTAEEVVIAVPSGQKDPEPAGGEEHFRSTLSLTVHVDAVMEFIHALHNDMPL